MSTRSWIKWTPQDNQDFNTQVQHLQLVRDQPPDSYPLLHKEIGGLLKHGQLSEHTKLCFALDTEGNWVTWIKTGNLTTTARQGHRRALPNDKDQYLSLHGETLQSLEPSDARKLVQLLVARNNKGQENTPQVTLSRAEQELESWSKQLKPERSQEGPYHLGLNLIQGFLIILGFLALAKGSAMLVLAIAGVYVWFMWDRSRIFKTTAKRVPPEQSLPTSDTSQRSFEDVRREARKESLTKARNKLLELQRQAQEEEMPELLPEIEQTLNNLDHIESNLRISQRQELRNKVMILKTYIEDLSAEELESK